ncbi:flagellar motor switch protein FliG [Candidatus Sneabacter namystus]|uniref:Flagellar motor switch protein FliG n=1 Tax=Candidatus Sneabacter namystus TaxID=2601646 RepID=A0A5C0UHJ7_9RICK|nr:FliG C-terminal domain-containing protein [Candidatus Sneabacter namystus]QEK39635.1 hypothetical protein FZC37_01650 [Candidatus Sneabacter namystus]
MSYEHLTGKEKAAIVLLSLSKSDASSLIAQFDEDEVIKVTEAIYDLGEISNETVSLVSDEFLNNFSKDKSVLGGKKVISDLLGTFLTSNEIETVLTKVHGDVWSAIEILDANAFAKYIAEEHPQTITFVLSKLSPNYMAKVLESMDSNLAASLMVRMVNMSDVPVDIAAQIEKCLKVELLSGIMFQGQDKKSPKRESVSRHLAKVLRSMASDEKERYISILDTHDAELAKEIKDLMFTFEDLISLEPSDVVKVVKNIDQKDLVLALKSASEQLKNLFFDNLPSRFISVIKEEWETIGKVRISDVRDAQKRISVVAQGLIKEGVVRACGQDDEDYI